MGPDASPPPSPNSPQLDDDHHPSDLSPRSSNSSLASSSESLLNTTRSVPSPAAALIHPQQRGQRRTSGGSSEVESASDSATHRSNSASTSSAPTEEEMNAFQNLRNAFELNRTSFSSYFHPDHQNSQSSDNEQMEQRIGNTFNMLGSPGSSHHHHQLLTNPTNRRVDESDDEEGQAMTMALVGHVSPTQTIVDGIAAVIYKCPLCCVVCSSRHDFNEHLVTHSSEHRACPKCSFTASNDDELREHVRDAHGTDEVDMLSDDEEVKTPKTNAQGKTKTFKCKQCDFSCVTKKEFWDHNKTHIRHGKMLHCPKCPFVTEYKHHLEYHLRNHMGSKPYQCTQCNYSCVNKSMLNSHLKSHSNVYQYRCADCSYATKYCHSLKLHLRKYNHKPAMVLNPDGTPNPLPIIDVYGTRRGPKIKRPDPLLEGLATAVPTVPGSPNKAPKKRGSPLKKDKSEKSTQKRQQQQLDDHDLSPQPASSPQFISAMPNPTVPPPLREMKEDHSSGDSDSDMMRMSQTQHHHAGKITQLPQAPISPSSIALILQRSNNTGNAELAPRRELNFSHPSASPNPIDIYNAAFNRYLLNPMFHMHNPSINDLIAAQLANDQKTQILTQLLQGMGANVQQQQQQNNPNDQRPSTSSMALDLSGRMSGNGAEEGKRRKRKGKALRYERRDSSEDEEEEMMMRGNHHHNMEDEALDFSNNNNNSSDYKDKNRKRSMFKHVPPTGLPRTSPPLYQNMICKYCEISFPDRELYTIHMNYHSGDLDPFLCRSCGKKTRDKVEFFKHLTTDPH